MRHAQQKYDVGALVGRFQTHTLHEGQRDLIQHVCDGHDKVVILLGVSPLWATKNNPLDFQARKQMIEAEFPNAVVNYVEDMASDAKWSAAVDRQIARCVTPLQTVVLYGSRDSFIPHYTGKLPTQELESDRVLSGTAQRRLVASGNTKATEDFRAGVIWATQSRYPTAFPTVDVAIIDEHTSKTLLARKPNEDRFRFVGGFVDPRDGSFEIAAKREAREETGLEVGPPEYVGSAKVDDWRYRSEDDKILTSLWVVTSLFGSARPADDVEEVRWFDIPHVPNGRSHTVPNGRSHTVLAGQIVSEHQPLLDMLLTHLSKKNGG